VPRADLRDDYLRRLEAAAARLPRDRREELVTELRAHIDAALAERGSADEATVRDVLERLGSPEEIVREADDAPPPAARRGTHDTVALLVLGFGGFVLPGLGWMIGLALVWASPSWSRRQKWIATALPVGTGLLGLLRIMSGGPLGPFELVLTVGAVGAVAAAFYLRTVTARRAPLRTAP
jgi:hypothetical protein